MAPKWRELADKLAEQIKSGELPLVGSFRISETWLRLVRGRSPRFTRPTGRWRPKAW